MREFIMTTVKGGLVFLIPFGFLLLVFGKIYELIAKVSEPMAAHLSMGPIAGFIVVDVLAVVFLIAVSFAAGMLMKLPSLISIRARLEQVFLANIPGYNFVDGMMRSMAAAQDQTANLAPVLAHFDDNSQIGFEIERTPAGIVVVYLPGSPNPWSGTTVYMTEARVEPVDIKTHEAIKIVRVLGRGSTQFAHRKTWPAKPES